MLLIVWLFSSFVNNAILIVCFLQLIWKETLIFLIFQILWTILFTICLSSDQQSTLKAFSQELGKNVSALPSCLLLSFLVTSAVNRRADLKKSTPAVYRVVALFMDSLKFDGPDIVAAAVLLDDYSRLVLLMW